MILLPPEALDSNYLIVQRNGDGGDTLNREGLYMIARYIQSQKLSMGTYWDYLDGLKEYFAALEKLTPNGKYIRHPNKWNDPQDVSRDQLIPNIVAMGLVAGFKRNLKEMFLQVAKNFMRFPNGDLCGPQEIGLFIRGLHEVSLTANLAYPVLLFTDLFLLGNCLIDIVRGRLDRNFTDLAINTTVALVQAKIQYPTPISHLAIKLYTTYRPLARPDLPELSKSFGLLSAFQWYFSPKNGGQPLDKVFEPILNYLKE